MTRKLAPADVIQQARTKLTVAIGMLVTAHADRLLSLAPGTDRRFVEAQARVERAISVYTRTVRNAKCKK